MARNSDKLRRENRASVGYGRPPVQHRFQPGTSGNPRGRPKVSPDLTALAAKELSRKRWIIVDGKRISVRTDEILIKKTYRDRQDCRDQPRFRLGLATS
jgi:hypothetical protein